MRKIKLKKDRKISDWEIVVFALISVLCFFYVGTMIIDWVLQPNYIILKQECNNISTAKDCLCSERVKWNGVEFNCKVINESSCIYYYVPICKKVEVSEIIWISQDCVAHCSTNIESLNKCVFVIDKKNLNEGWIFTHNGYCIEYNCDGKECKKGDCHIYKIGDYEVKVE